ncbi:hypothetical protein ACSBR1_016041 [Camellia fascicularis]
MATTGGTKTLSVVFPKSSIRASSTSVWASPVTKRALIMAYLNIKNIVKKITTQVDDGSCVTYTREEGFGNFMKMVHNGIEYGDMKLISKAYYNVLKNAGG